MSTEVRVTYQVQQRLPGDSRWQVVDCCFDLPEARNRLQREMRDQPPEPGERLRIVRVREVTTVTTRVVR